MDFRILQNLPYKNAYGQYAYLNADEFYKNTGINSKEFDDDLYLIRENILVDDQPYDVNSNFLYSPFYNTVVSENTPGVFQTPLCESGFYFINLYLDEDTFNQDIHCCIDMKNFAERRILLEFNIASNNINTQIYYDTNTNDFKNSTAPNEVLVQADVVLNDNFLPIIQDINSYALSTIYIAEWGDEASTKDKETLIFDFQNNKFQFEKSGITTGLKHFYQTPGVHKIKGFTEIISGNTSQCPYISGGDDGIDTYSEIKDVCDSNQDCLGYKVSIIDDWIYVWYGTEIPTTSYWVYGSVTSIISDTTNAIIAKQIGDVSEGEGIAQIVDDVVVDYCLRFGSTGDMEHEPWSMYESFTTTDYFEAKINLNVDEVFKDEFEEIGGIGFDYLPWSETYPIIGGISDESKYINDVINIVNQNQFKETEVLDKLKAEEALQNDELGKHIGKVDLGQTRIFKGAYDMDYLLMVYDVTNYNAEIDEYNPYFDIYNNPSNLDGYWNGETETTTFQEESCVGLIFINDSTNSTLKNNCILELNFGDTQNDVIIDTSGQNNKGIIIGDYSLQKTSKDIPLIKDDVMITPVTDSTNGAF